ncbi:hypothetical protein ACFL5T_00170 [Gemmatimonadota bacterium]
MDGDRKARKKDASQKMRTEIASRLREMMTRRGTNPEQLGIRLEELRAPVVGGDRRNLRRVLAAELPPNAYLVVALSELLDCSPGWLLSGYGHPDLPDSPMPELSEPDACGLDGLPMWVKLRVRHLAWNLALAETKSADVAFSRLRPICREIGGYLLLPTRTRYFERPLSEIKWIEYASRLLEALEQLVPRRGPNEEEWPGFLETAGSIWADDPASHKDTMVIGAETRGRQLGL